MYASLTSSFMETKPACQCTSGGLTGWDATGTAMISGNSTDRNNTAERHSDWSWICMMLGKEPGFAEKPGSCVWLVWCSQQLEFVLCSRCDLIIGQSDIEN